MSSTDLFLFRLLKLSLLQVASDFRRHARSYRGYHVGAAVLVRSPALGPFESVYRIFLGHNTKMDPAGSDRCCAEHDALKRAQEAGYTIVIAIAVVAPVQADDESGRAYLTTHCCGTCRRMFAGGALGVRPDTVILTADANDLSITEQFSFLELCELHGDGHLFRPFGLLAN